MSSTNISSSNVNDTEKINDIEKNDTEKIASILNHLVKPLLSHPAEMSMNVIEASATVLVEMTVHADDKEYLTSDEMTILRAVQQLLSVASSRERKYSLELIGQ